MNIGIIDVSKHQGIIDWEKVKGQIDGAIIRCGYGDNIASQDDVQFKRNADECTRLNIPFGVYIYSYAKTAEQAKSEAEHVLRKIKGYDLSLPVYLDLEEAGTERGAVERAIIFGDIIEKAGYWCGIYANLNWWQKYLGSKLDRFTKWVARYSPEKPNIQGMDMWQYSSVGTINGISGKVDMNICYRNFISEIKGKSCTGATNIKYNKCPRLYKIGDRVEVSTYYASSTDTCDKAVHPKSYVQGTITKIIDKDVYNPYLLNNGEIGWCNNGDIRTVNGRTV